METFNIIGIDPGGNTGIAVYTIALPDYKVINIETIVIHQNRIYKLVSDKGIPI